MALRPTHILAGLLFAYAAAAAHAAELGDARVASHIGQPLVADVELTLIEEVGAPVGVRLADPNVYRGANIAMPAVLGTLNMSVTRRDGKQFLHLTSIKPVESRHLHVFLELTDGGQRSVRLVTLWLTPDPNPAPPPLPAVVPPMPVAAVQPAREAPAAVSVPAPPVRPQAERRPARVEEGSRQGVVKAPAKPRATAPTPLHAVHAPMPPAAAPACTPARVAQVDACTALDAKNAALRQDLGRLENRVKILQVASGQAPATPHAGEESTPKEAPRIQLKPKKAAAPEPETPWLLFAGIGAALLALGGGLAWFLRRRRAAAATRSVVQDGGQDGGQEGEAAPAKPGFVTALKARLTAALRRKPAPEGSAEPSAGVAAGAPAALE